MNKQQDKDLVNMLNNLKQNLEDQTLSHNDILLIRKIPFQKI